MAHLYAKCGKRNSVCLCAAVRNDDCDHRHRCRGMAHVLRVTLRRTVQHKLDQRDLRAKLSAMVERGQVRKCRSWPILLKKLILRGR
jgi:hypothetical protein